MGIQFPFVQEAPTTPTGISLLARLISKQNDLASLLDLPPADTQVLVWSHFLIPYLFIRTINEKRTDATNRSQYTFLPVSSLLACRYTLSFQSNLFKSVRHFHLGVSTHSEFWDQSSWISKGQHLWPKVEKLFMKAGLQDAPLNIWNLARVSQQPLSKQTLNHLANTDRATPYTGDFIFFCHFLFFDFFFWQILKLIKKFPKSKKSNKCVQCTRRMQRCTPPKKQAKVLIPRKRTFWIKIEESLSLTALLVK